MIEFVYREAPEFSRFAEQWEEHKIDDILYKKQVYTADINMVSLHKTSVLTL